MNDLVVNNELPSTIVNNQSSNTASTLTISSLDSVEELVVVNDRQTLLHITSLGHADNAAIVANVQNTVLLEDRSQHALHIDRCLWVGVEAGFLLKLLGEEIHTEIAVLSSLSTHTDADNFTRSALKNDQIANADEVARDGDCVGSIHATTRFNEADLLNSTTTNTTWSRCFVYDDISALVVVMVVVVVVIMVGEWMEHAIGSTLKTAAEGVVLAFVVVVAHVSFVLDVGLDFYVFGRATTFVLNVVGRVGTATIVLLGDIELVLNYSVVGLTAIVLDVNRVSGASTVDFDINLGVFVISGTLIPVLKSEKMENKTWRDTNFSRVTSTSG